MTKLLGILGIRAGNHWESGGQYTYFPNLDPLPSTCGGQLLRNKDTVHVIPELLGATTGRRNLKPALAIARKDLLISRHATQVLFYGGVRHYEDGDRATALDLFEKCVGLNAVIEEEWLLARALCQQLGGG